MDGRLLILRPAADCQLAATRLSAAHDAATFMTERIRDILCGLRTPSDNIVARARRMVEAQVPLDRRGPGWDRHWRELEAYLDLPGQWSSARQEDHDDG